ncbi:MAG: fibronectin type III domain-containing protein, partial [Spirochaetaceae bacterium]|nr:fibronectin type III domain-containing protein [Spirochaetaceae bacterium]
MYLKTSKFACGASGSKVAPWINAAGRTLELRNGGTHEADLLASVFVKGVPAPTPAPTVSASFNVGEVKLGGSADLSWSSSNATSCSGSPGIGSADPSGSAAFTPSAVGNFSVTVTCTGDGGSGSATAKVHVVDVPDAPAKPTVTASGSTKLAVSWTAPSSNGAAITGYQVRHRINGNMADWGSPAGAGTSTSKTLTGLTANTAYQVQVRAGNRLGQGDWSAPADGSTPAEPPPTPASFTVPASDADGNYEVSWAASAGAVRYQLQERIGTLAWTDAHKGAATSAELKGRSIATYGYQVRACAAAAESSCSGWTAERTVTVSGALTADPNPSPNGSYTVSWTPALVAGQYRLQESIDGGTTWPKSHTLTATQKAFSGKADGAYVYQVQSCIHIGTPVGWACTPLVASQLTVTVARSLAPPTLGIAPDPAPGGDYRVSWTASKDATGHMLQERTDGGDWSDVTGVTGRFKDISNPSAAVYGYQVKACDDGGKCGSWSVEATVRVPPAAPTVSGECKDGSYELSWPEVTGAATYVVEQREGTDEWTEAHNGSGNRKALSLTAGASHSFRAKACAADDNCSEWGAVLAVTAPDCTGPNVPGNLRLEATGSDDYSIKWDAVSGTDISYVLEQKRG